MERWFWMTLLLVCYVVLYVALASALTMCPFLPICGDVF